MLSNKKGAALLQVLLVTAILAGIATMLLRASLSRTTSVRQTRRAVSEELLIESCMAEVNMMWSNKTPEAFKRDMAGCWMNCKTPATGAELNIDASNYLTSACNTDGNSIRYYICKTPQANVSVKATFEDPSVTGAGDCKLTYSVERGDAEQM